MLERGRTRVVVLGAGPAGLGAAYRLARRGAFDVTVLERQACVGGNAASFDLAGVRVDFGSHRLHRACPPAILEDISAMLGADLLDRPRNGRMLLRGRWVRFPLKPLDLAANLPLSFTAGVVRDSIGKARSQPPSDTFEGVLSHGLGRTICQDFYFPYARKIWGVEPARLDAEQARRRVSTGSIGKMVRKVLGAVPGLKKEGAGRFYYPRRGFGQISEAYYCAAKKAGADIVLEASITAIQAPGGAVRSVCFRHNGMEETIPTRLVLSTIPLPALVRMVTPAAPAEILQAASSLRFRSMLLIYLVLETDRFTEFDAHYFPGADIAITRLSEPKNYGLANLPGRTVLCAELPCSTEDEVWRSPDLALANLVKASLSRAGLPVTAPVAEVQVRRMPQAYPIYTLDYRAAFDYLDRWVGSVDGLVTFGRQGLFAHDNTHHTLAMAYALEQSLSDNGALDAETWSRHRRDFERHVVED